MAKEKKWSRPKDWYPTTVERLVTTELPPVLGPLTHGTAWRYVYAIVMWAQNAGTGSEEQEEFEATEEEAGEVSQEEVGIEEPTVLGVEPELFLHLEESDKLRRAGGKLFARKGERYLRDNLCKSGPCDPFGVVDQIGKAERADRLAEGCAPQKKTRDNNVTGAAFETVIQVLIDKLCRVRPERTPALNTLQGFELAPVAYHSKPDLALFDTRNFRVLISTKWTLRKERIGTYLHEAYFYRQRRPDLQIAFVVSEFNMNILNWLVQDPLVDRVYHVNKGMLLQLNDPLPLAPLPRDLVETADYRRWLNVSERVFDLSQLFTDVNLLKKKSSDG